MDSMFAVLTSVLGQFAASTSDSCSRSFLGLKTWFAYFPDNWFGPTSSSSALGKCDINSNFQFLPQNGHSGLLLIALAILDDLLRIAALVAVGYIIYGGIQYVISQGSPDATKKAQQTIINSLIGLVVAILASAIVAFIGNRLGA